jgi:hypothetical protein
MAAIFDFTIAIKNNYFARWFYENVDAEDREYITIAESNIVYYVVE